MPNWTLIWGMVGGIAAYGVFLGLLIRFALRWSRRILDRKGDALGEALVAAGGRKLGDGVQGGLYTGTERIFEVGGRRVYTNAYYVSRSSVRVNLRVETPPLPYVVIFPEKAVDRFGKAIGLNREVQTGDKAFDDAAYVDSYEAEPLVARLLTPPEVRAAAQELLSLGYKVQCSGRGLEAFQVVYGMNKVDGSTAPAAVAALGRLAAALPGFADGEFKPRTTVRSYRLAAVLVGAWVGGFFVAGLSAAFVDRTLDPSAAFSAFVVGGGICWALYVAGLAAALRGKSSAMRTLLVGAFLGVIAVPLGSGAALLWLNQSLDAAPATDRVEQVRGRHRYQSDCTLTVDSWRTPGASEHVPVPRADYDRLAIGDFVELRVHPGRFGWSWIEKATKVAPPAPP